MIEFNLVSKRYGPLTALEPTKLNLVRRQTHVLLGPSGCGKSTMLRLILGLIAPDSGEIRVDGAPVSAANAQEIRQKTGYVVQEGGLFPHLTARQNACLVAKYHRWSQQRQNERVSEVAQLARFPESALGRFPSELSGGQRQRLSLVRALMLDPELLLLDEPFGALDPLVRAELQGQFKSLFMTLNKTVVMVTHDLSEAAALADNVILLRDGRVLQTGPFDQLYDSPADDFVAKFFDAQRHHWESRN